MKIVVLGGGLVGSAIARDLAAEEKFQVTVVDGNSERIHQLNKENSLEAIVGDLSRSENVSEAIQDADLVIGALPGYMAFQMLKTVIEAGKNIVDISFFPENSLELDELARQKGVIAVVDCGVAPGCSNLFLGHVTTLLDETEQFLCYVGGLPRVREWPYEYKVVFSPFDVIEEYTRIARYVENGQLVTREALSDIEQLQFSEIGTLEAFNSDGLRTLINTMKVPNMKEKTLRFPGHAEKMKILRETGFFNKNEIEIRGQKISPLEFTAKILFPKWKLLPGEEDFTVMKIIVEGTKNGRKMRYEYDLLDNYDRETNTTSMARTTGYTASVMSRIVLDGSYKREGVSPLEIVGQDGDVYQKLLRGLAERNVVYREKIIKSI